MLADYESKLATDKRADIYLRLIALEIHDISRARLEFEEHLRRCSGEIRGSHMSYVIMCGKLGGPICAERRPSQAMHTCIDSTKREIAIFESASDAITNYCTQKSGASRVAIDAVLRAYSTLECDQDVYRDQCSKTLFYREKGVLRNIVAGAITR